MSEVGYKKPPKDKQFKKGKSGNPNGKPKGTLSSKTILKRFMGIKQDVQNPITGAQEKLTVAEILYIQQLAKARKGDLAAFREIMDRWEGKPQQSIDHTSDGEKLPSPILPPTQELAEKAKEEKKIGEEAYDEPLIPEDD